jgi:hypothetical protein
VIDTHPLGFNEMGHLKRNKSLIHKSERLQSLKRCLQKHETLWELSEITPNK